MDPRFGSLKQCDHDPSLENVNKLEILKTEYDLQLEYIAQGAIIRSRARWYEQGEKSDKYLLNLESSRGKKSTIRKIIREDKSLTTNPKVIMDELKGFYSNLYYANSSRRFRNPWLTPFSRTCPCPNFLKYRKGNVSKF